MTERYASAGFAMSATGLVDELATWAAAGERATFWWRDDDAAKAAPALDRLLGLSASAQVPLALAVIPAHADASLAEAVADADLVSVMQHGFAHVNHAGAGERASELGEHRPAAIVLGELAEGRLRLGDLVGERFLAVVAPPWNRIGDSVLRGLPAIGFHGVSRFWPRASAFPAPGVREVNGHVDVLKWDDPVRFHGATDIYYDMIVHLRARRLGEADGEEATGIVTHHLDMDEAAWSFVETLFDLLNDHPAVEWQNPPDLFPPF